MLRLTLELVPHGDEMRRKIIGTMHIINDGSGTPESGNYHASLWEDEATHEHYPQRVHEFPRRERKAWDLAFIALRRFLAWRNPYVGSPRDEMLYVRQTPAIAPDEYVPVEPFQGFPMSGVLLVHSGKEDVQRCSYRWIGDIPPEDALTYAAAQVHHDRACKALTAMKNKSVDESLQVFTEEKRRLMAGEPLYRWEEPSISDVVACVLSAIAEGKLEAERKTGESV